jgi:hypothetical protein
MYWLEVLRDAELKTGNEIERLMVEANELIAIFAAPIKLLKRISKSEIYVFTTKK